MCVWICILLLSFFFNNAYSMDSDYNDDETDSYTEWEGDNEMFANSEEYDESDLSITLNDNGKHSDNRKYPIDIIHTASTNGDNVALCKLNPSWAHAKKLILKDTKINAIRGLSAFTCLTYLNISHNQLTTIHKAIGKLTHLEALHASHNKIAYVSKKISHLRKLVIVDLDSNNLKKLPNIRMPHTGETLPKLTLHVPNNPKIPALTHTEIKEFQKSRQVLLAGIATKNN